MITCHVTRLANTVHQIKVEGHANEAGEIGVLTCTSVSSIVGVARELLGGSPMREGGGDYSVKVLPQPEAQQRAEAIIRAFRKLEHKLFESGYDRIFLVNDDG